MHDHLKDQPRTVVITGGTKGIGLGITKHFYKSGYKVIAMSRNKPEDWVEDDRCRYLQGDVRKKQSHKEAVENALDWSGRIDAYINCAGVSLWRPLEEIDEDFWQMIFETNASGVLWGSQAAAEKLKEGGVIINVSSLAGKRGSAKNSAYCASKFAVNGLTQALAKELGPRGIRCNAVCPVYVPTDHILSSLKDENSPTGGGDVDEYLDTFAKSQAALQRLPMAEEVASTCGFLDSPAAGAITGQCINVDCGVLPQ